MLLSHIRRKTDWGRSDGVLEVDKGAFSLRWEETVPWSAEKG